LPTLLWIESGSCSGESMAILGAEGSGKGSHNIAQFLEKNGVQLLWHPSLSAESPREVLQLVDRIAAGEQELTLLCVEGSIIHGPNGTGRFDTFGGRPKRDIIRALCDRATYVFAMGTCAAFGGIPAAPPNPSSSGGLQYDLARPGGLLGEEWRSRAGLPVLNLAGCPTDAATMIRTMTWVLQGMPLELDRFNRPFSVRPCLSDAINLKCGTGERVGYACYGCIAAKFPMSKPLFDHVPVAARAKPLNPDAPRTFTAYGAAEPACPLFETPVLEEPVWDEPAWDKPAWDEPVCA
jgi:Ni,Fe-hydrogenase I small subunit